MEKKRRMYIAIDLKSFYASVECRDRGMDPLDTNLVVADESRTDKTICLAVTPSLKAFGIPGRARLFEVKQKVKEVNAGRKHDLKGEEFQGISSSASELSKHKDLELGFVIAPPRMARYMEYSTQIYSIYMKYVAPEDVIVYSVDEVFMDVTDYLRTYGVTARQLAMKMILEVLDATGITATAGIGTNLYLAKVAMDIRAKHMPADENGVRMAELTEESYRRELWSHRPLTDFWRVGAGYARKLKSYGIYTMGDVARCSEEDEDLLYKLFGKNAELLIDHAWGWEPCAVSDVKSYSPENNSLSSGQVLHCPYEYEEAKTVLREMTDALALELSEKHLMTDQIVITIGYDVDNLLNPSRRKAYHGEVVTDRYGRKVPKHAHGTANLECYSASGHMMLTAVTELYDRIVDKSLLIRRMNVVANHLLGDSDAMKIREEEKRKKEEECTQLDLFSLFGENLDQEGQFEEGHEKKLSGLQEASSSSVLVDRRDSLEVQRRQKEEFLEKEKRLQEATLTIKKRYGKNAILKGMNFREGATMRDRNQQIGGHKA